MDIRKIAIFAQKNINNFCCIFFLKFLVFGHQNPGFGLDPDPDSLEMLDSINPDT